MYREELRDRPGNLPTPFIIALAEVAAESIPTRAATNILGRVMMDPGDAVQYVINPQRWY
jgi:hypothetical protein